MERLSRTTISTVNHVGATVNQVVPDEYELDGEELDGEPLDDDA